MENEKKQIVYLAGLAMAGAVALTGCSKNTKDEPVRVVQPADKPAPKIFHPNEHIYIERKWNEYEIKISTRK